jgi:hypothetical protein
MSNPPTSRTRDYTLTPTLDLSGMGGPARSLHFHRHSATSHWGARSFHDKAVILEEDVNICDVNY